MRLPEQASFRQARCCAFPPGSALEKIARQSEGNQLEEQMAEEGHFSYFFPVTLPFCPSLLYTYLKNFLMVIVFYRPLYLVYLLSCSERPPTTPNCLDTL